MWFSKKPEKYLESVEFVSLSKRISMLEANLEYMQSNIAVLKVTFKDLQRLVNRKMKLDIDEVEKEKNKNPNPLLSPDGNPL